MVFEADLSDTFIVTAYSNTARYKRRPFLYNQFKKMVQESGVDMLTVEIALGDRKWEATTPHDSNALQLRTIEEFWHKENALNLGIYQGMKQWPHKKRVCWIDSDCAPVGKTFKEWIEETWHELQHYEIVQMWEWLQPLDIDLNPLCAPNPSFMANYIKYGTPYPKKIPGYPVSWGSPGLAWAANVSALQHVNYLGDAGILGAGDWYFAHMGITDLPFPDMLKHGYTKDYVDYWSQRQTLFERWIKRDIGYVKGLYYHYFHGKTKNRQYNTRENILIKNQFAPSTDLKRDHQGLWQLETWEPRQIKLRDQVRRYFRSRNEDSIDS